MTGEFDAVVSEVRERVAPDATERHALERVVEELLRRTEEAAEALPVEADVVHVGSTARDTWLAGDHDVDIFVRFPPGLPRGELERHGLAVGRTVLPDGREEYAEHPYVSGQLDGFAADIVPCYAVASAEEIASAVDRTPFHNAYLADRLTPDLTDEIRVFKQLLRGIGVYGSDLRTRGFSGYLTELLVLEYGSVEATLEAVEGWHPPVEIDPAGHGNDAFDAPLCVIDPTDPGRNVAAVLTAENLARLQHYARDLLEDPRSDPFFPDPDPPATAAAVREHLDRRGTTPVAVVFDAPDLVDDELYPQVRKALDGIGGMLERHGFETLRRACFATTRVALWFELAVAERPGVERHAGPPVSAREHAEAFYHLYADTDVYGPFLDGDRYVVERERPHTTAVGLLESDAIHDARLGPAVERALLEGYEIVAGPAVAALAEEFGEELHRYFDPTP